MADGAVLFDPARFAPVRGPLGRARGLPADCYTDPAFRAAELHRVFAASWNLVGRADEVPSPGDYRAVHTAFGSILLLRGEDGAVRAFANTCRHRGTRLAEGAGNVASLVCPHHGWTYGLDGRLTAAPGIAARGFTPRDYGLTALPIAIWQGFLFVGIEPSAEGPEAAFQDLATLLASHRLDEMVCVHRVERRVACDWKIALENGVEDYHTATVHAGSIGLQRHRLASLGPAYGAMVMERAGGIGTLPGEAAGLPVIPGLSAPARRASYFAALFPSTILNCTRDSAWWLSALPDGPGACRIVLGACVPATSAAAPDFDTRIAPYLRRWNAALEEDVAIMESRQANLMANGGSAAGPFAPSEILVHRFANWLLDRILAPSP
ncbi:MAG: aromatic ring-hydroxylating dioxygenase subunit alpha [Rhodospirillaceae bacterium]|nr:aromatic ring-hydroxylating dioxygenase subunit alpha [Rhodospirillaceae bacterium]MBT6118862.1 aromatic ring-hydroxylating dioxygenase subunit alpha [Rhodospirillaceae bacterium]